MKNQRKGNDLNVMWQLLHEGEPFRLEGRDITIYLKDSFGKTEVKDFRVSDNTIFWTFYGKDQKHNGRYSLELIINEGEKGMITTDVCDFVNLVPHSCMVGGEDSPNVETETIELTSTLEYVAGVSYDDTEVKNELARLERDKQDTIADLATIREGASKGATALQSVPETYATKQYVKDALGEIPSAESSVFEAKYKETSYEEVKAAFEAKKVVYCHHNNRVYLLSTFASNVAYFSVILGNYYYRLAFYPSNPNPTWSEDSKNFTHSLKNLDNGNAEITIAGQTAEVATPQYVESAIQQSGTPSGDPMHYMFEAVGAIYNATDADIPMVGVYGDSYVHKAKHWHLNELGDITNEEMRRIYAAPIGNGLSWNRMLVFFPHRTHLLFYYYGQNSSNSDMVDASIINGLAASKLVKFVMPPTVSNKIPTFGAPQSFAYNCKDLTTIINPFAFSSAVGGAAFGRCSRLRDIRLHNLGHSIAFKDSPEFSTASILYMVANSAATSAIVITLHADAYARAMADAEIVAALEAHPNVSLASA